jgi:acyl-CoA dehydrogenase
VNYDLTEEQRRIRETLTAFAEREIKPHSTEWDKKEIFPREVIRKLGELGFLGVAFPEKWGGGGADTLSQVLVVEGLSRFDASVGLTAAAHMSLSTGHIANFASDEHRDRYVPDMLAAKKIGAWCLTEPNSGSDAAAMLTRANRVGDNYVINGSKMFITNGATADVCFLAARVETGDTGKRHRGISMFLVERTTPGFTVSRTLDKTGMRASDTAELSFSDMRVPATNLLGREGVGFYEVMRVFQRERLVAGLHAVAMADRALADTIAYVRERQAFGGPLSDKQAIRHKLADLATQIEAGRWLTYAACAKFAAGEACVREVSMAKLYTAEMVNRVAYDCVQLHGGYGYMREYAIERFARDARLMTIGGGTSEIMRDIIAKAVLP